EQDAIALGRGARQPRVLKRPILSVQVRVREVTHIVNDHGVVRPPRKVERYTRPALGAFEFRNVRNVPLFRPRGGAGEDRAQPGTALDGVVADLPPERGLAEQVVRDVHRPPLTVVAPAVIRTGEVAAVHFAERELELAVSTA